MESPNKRSRIPQRKNGLRTWVNSKPKHNVASRKISEVESLDGLPQAKLKTMMGSCSDSRRECGIIEMMNHLIRSKGNVQHCKSYTWEDVSWSAKMNSAAAFPFSGRPPADLPGAFRVKRRVTPLCRSLSQSQCGKKEICSIRSGEVLRSCTIKFRAYGCSHVHFAGVLFTLAVSQSKFCSFELSRERLAHQCFARIEFGF